MRLWLLGGLAAVLAVVAVAGADQGGLPVKNEVRVRISGKDKKPPPPSKPCPGCYSILNKHEETPMMVRARRQGEKPTPRPTWRPGVLIPLGGAEARVRVSGKENKPPPPSRPCPGCYSLLSKPVRARRQGEKPRPGTWLTSDWNPGSPVLLRPGKEEKLDPVSTRVPDSEVRSRRDVEKPAPRRRPRLRQRPRPRPKPTEQSPYHSSSMTLLSSGIILSPQGPDPPGRVRRAVEGAQPRPLKPKRPKLPCSGCYSPLVSFKDDDPQVRVKRDVQKPQRRRKTITWPPGSVSFLLQRKEQSMEVLSVEIPLEDDKAELPCPGCHGSVAPGQEERAAERILHARSRREGHGPRPAAKRKARQRARAGLYCAGCYSALTLRSEADGGSSGD